jgi:hypothetical protein
LSTNAVISGREKFRPGSLTLENSAREKSVPSLKNGEGGKTYVLSGIRKGKKEFGAKRKKNLAYVFCRMFDEI